MPSSSSVLRRRGLGVPSAQITASRPATADASEERSMTSPRTTSTASENATRAGSRTNAAVSWPRASASPTISRPSPPVAPTIRIRIRPPTGRSQRKERDPDRPAVAQVQRCLLRTLGQRYPRPGAESQQRCQQQRPDLGDPIELCLLAPHAEHRRRPPKRRLGTLRETIHHRSEPIPSSRRLRLVLIKDRLKPRRRQPIAEEHPNQEQVALTLGTQLRIRQPAPKHLLARGSDLVHALGREGAPAAPRSPRAGPSAHKRSSSE